MTERRLFDSLGDTPSLGPPASTRFSTAQHSRLATFLKAHLPTTCRGRLLAEGMESYGDVAPHQPRCNRK
jgi:hypothetical protein